jgi:hypothetical protein
VVHTNSNKEGGLGCEFDEHFYTSLWNNKQKRGNEVMSEHVEEKSENFRGRPVEFNSELMSPVCAPFLLGDWVQ